MHALAYYSRLFGSYREFRKHQILITVNLNVVEDFLQYPDNLGLNVLSKEKSSTFIHSLAHLFTCVSINACHKHSRMS